jgi:UDP-N-acetylmuramate dehydrogenase
LDELDIEKEIKGNVRYDEPLSEHTTYGIGGPADIFVVPVDADDLLLTVRNLKDRGVPVFPLGMGSNVLAADSGFRGAVISLKEMKKIKPSGENGIYAEAGVPLSALVETAASLSLSGLEFASGIPGSVGGAVIMNAGAYGEEMEGVVKEVTFVDKAGEVKKRRRDELLFQYRHLTIDEGDIVLGVLFSLTPGDEEKIRKKMGEKNEKRREKHPLGVRSAGSVFKNIKEPEVVPAGRIVDGLGLKGKRVGNAEISPMHGNFIVNRGGATAKDVMELIELIKGRAKEERGIDLQLEIKILGKDE